MSSPAAAFIRVLEVFGRMEIPYAVCGSVASSAHGIPRTTMDIDLVVDLPVDRIEAFAAALRPDFYADAGLIREQFGHGRAANLIHIATAWKIDLFPLKHDEYGEVEFGRRSLREVRPDGKEPVECAVATAEDTILRKLEWYRAGGETSERQWNDLRGICGAVRGRLDAVYLRRWARHLMVSDLLDRLLAETPG